MTTHRPTGSFGTEPATASVALARRMAELFLMTDAATFGPKIWDTIRPSVVAVLVAENDQAGLREWHMFLLDLRSALTVDAPAVAAEIAEVAGTVRAAAFLARRNPPDDAMRRPASRRLLKLVFDRGGSDCRLATLAEAMKVSPQNLANIARPLIVHGLLIRTQDQHDARQGLVSLTDAGRRTVEADRHGHARATEFRDQTRIVEVNDSTTPYRPTVYLQSVVDKASQFAVAAE